MTVVDIVPARAALAHAIGARFAPPGAAPADCDLVFHASGTAAGLATALRLAGEEASIVELSWYGSGDVAAPLGEAFHSRRLRLDLEPGRQGRARRIARAGRTAAAWRRRSRCSTEPVLDALLAPALAFDELPAKLPSVLASDSNAVCPLIRYPAADETQQ